MDGERWRRRHADRLRQTQRKDRGKPLRERPRAWTMGGKKAALALRKWTTRMAGSFERSRLEKKKRLLA